MYYPISDMSKSSIFSCQSDILLSLKEIIARAYALYSYLRGNAQAMQREQVLETLDHAEHRRAGDQDIEWLAHAYGFRVRHLFIIRGHFSLPQKPEQRASRADEDARRC